LTALPPPHQRLLLWAKALDPAIPCRNITDNILSPLLSTTGKLTRLTGAGANAVAEARQMAVMAPESFMAVMLWRR